MNPVTQEIPRVDASASAAGNGPWWNSANFRAWAPAALLLVVFWLLIFNQQRLEWTVNVVYAYGWAVPFLSGFLLWERGRLCPPPGKVLPRLAVVGVALALLAAYLPLRVIQEANPDWVRVNWGVCITCAALTLTAFASAGGWPYVRNFGFPILFCFTALPWPTWMGGSIIQGLMRANATICAELLTLGGMPAIAEGNLVQIADHWLNVEEACSGIRSLQTAFMMSLFLGEFYRMRLIRRGVLLLASFGVALLVNVGRTVTLALATSRGKGEEWHDTVGNIAMVLCLVGLWLLSDWLNRGNKSRAAAPRVTSDSRVIRPPFPIWLAVCGVLWLGAAETLNGAWYSSHEKGLAGIPVWSVDWPKANPSFKQGAFGDITKAILKYNEGETASWAADSGFIWQMYYLRWYPGRVSKYLSRGHHPTVCLPASGLKLVSETGLWQCEVDGVLIPFSTYVFSQGTQEVYVFHAIVEDRPADDRPITYGQVGSSERIDSVLRHERNLGQRVVGISLRGPGSPIEARDAVASQLKTLIKKESPGLASLTTP